MLAIPSISSLPASPVAASLDQASARLSASATLSGITAESNTSAATFFSAATLSQSAAASSASQASALDSSQSGASSIFLAQLLGQGSVNAVPGDTQDESPVALADAAVQFAPATEYNRLVAYSYVKYKPSDAGLQGSNVITFPPLPTGTDAAASVSSGNSSAALGQNDTVAAANDYQAYSNTQSRNQSVPVSGAQLFIAG